MEALQTTSVLSQALSVASPSANIAPSTAGAVPGVPSRAHGSAINSDGANIMIGIACMLLVLCMAAVGGRLLARRRAKLRLEADDYLALVALVSDFQSVNGVQVILICISSSVFNGWTLH